eukprot:TRINITY_DN13080_c0_g1_i1.p1 TRINITY_DN13080_c0_g1~~TRINITY_DN13080_c0_g1_i1.p1  ORF type:complete len:223 (-),score=58.79 TRINITY_DN13080_c0_g1_i1:21-689(-)
MQMTRDSRVLFVLLPFHFFWKFPKQSKMHRYWGDAIFFFPGPQQEVEKFFFLGPREHKICLSLTNLLPKANKKLKQVGNVIQQFNKLQRISATPNYPAPINICPSPTFQPIITTTVITPMVTPPPPEPIELTLELPITTTTTVTVAKPEANPLQNKEMFALDHHHHHPYQSSKDLRYLQSRQRLLRVFLEENVIEQSVFVLEMQHLEDVVTYTQCREKASEE